MREREDYAIMIWAANKIGVVLAGAGARILALAKIMTNDESSVSAVYQAGAELGRIVRTEFPSYAEDCGKVEHEFLERDRLQKG